LFVDFLTAELIKRHPDELPGLHARASEWFAAQGLWREAVHHAVEAGDYVHAVDVANRCAMTLVRDGDYLVLQTLLAKLPENLHHKAQGGCLVMRVLGQLREQRLEHEIIAVANQRHRATIGNLDCVSVVTGLDRVMHR